MLRYFWWGLSCRQGGFAALEGDAQLRYHLDAIKTAVLRADSLTRIRLKAALDAGLLIGSLLTLEPAIATGVNFAAAFKDADAVQASSRLLSALRRPRWLPPVELRLIGQCQLVVS
jgi:hypothetical protein